MRIYYCNADHSDVCIIANEYTPEVHAVLRM